MLRTSMNWLGPMDEKPRGRGGRHRKLVLLCLMENTSFWQETKEPKSRVTKQTEVQNAQRWTVDGLNDRS